MRIAEPTAMQGEAMPQVLVMFAGRSARAAALAAAALALAMPHGAAQDVAAPPALSIAPNAEPQVPPPQSPPPAERDNPGLIQELGRLFDGARKQIDVLNRNATSTGRTIGDAAADVGKTATGVVVTPLSTRIVSGHERCGVAPNGAPDCVTAAAALCQRHGYRTGKSLDFTSAEQCKPTVFLAGRDNGPACVTVTFISRAVCQ